MSGHSTFEPKNAFLKWFEARLPILGLLNASFVDYPTPRNLNYWWTFGGILSFMLGVQIITGVILCIGRAVGETACLFVTMGGSSAMPTSLLSGGRTLSMHLLHLVLDTNAFEKALATGVVLIVVIAVINAITNWLSQRFRARMTGGA